MTPIQKAKEIAISFLRYCMYISESHDENIAFDNWLKTKSAAALLSGEDWKKDGNVRSEREIMESLAEMERMITMAGKALDNSTVKQTPFLLEKFAIWKERSSARVSILKWVLGLPYLYEPNPILPEPNKP